MRKAAGDAGREDMKSADKTAERLADRIAERLAQEVGAADRAALMSGIGLYGSVGERTSSRLQAERALALGMPSSDRSNSFWHVGMSGDSHGRIGGYWGSNSSLGAGGASAGTDRWGLGASGEVYGLSRHTAEGKGSFWHSGDRWDHGTTAKNAAGATLRSSLDSAKLAMLERSITSPRTIPHDDPTLALLNKASSQLWHHLLNASPTVPRSPDQPPSAAATDSKSDPRELVEFDRWVKNLSRTTPRELDESPIKRASANATAPSAVKAPPAATSAAPALPAGINASMAWQV
jgi:hypothetical protein